MHMAQASAPPENENFNTVSVNLLSQALGPVTGVLVPRAQIYSSQKLLTEILGPLNSFIFQSLETTPCGTGSQPFPVEVRDSSNRTLLRFFGRPTGQIVYAGPYGGNHRIFMAVLVDSHQRELLYAKFLVGTGLDPEYNLTCKEGWGEQSVGKVFVPSPFSCEARYKVAALNLFTNQSTGPLMEAHGTSSNACCSSSDTLLFGCPDPNSNALSGGLNSRIVGELKRIPNSVSNNPNGASQVIFDQKLPIVHKIWILYISYHHHYRNFANTALSGNGQRGLYMSYVHMIIWLSLGFMLLMIIIMVILFSLLNKK